MSRSPCIPCLTCGKLLWPSRATPDDERICRDCTLRGRVRNRDGQLGWPAHCAWCAQEFVSVRRDAGRRTQCCSKKCEGRRRAAAAGQPNRYKTDAHRAAVRRRRTRLAGGDLTSEQERALRAAATTCPLCDVALVSEPYTPRSAELDHIDPLAGGGRHTRGNVRVICRCCNTRRGKIGVS